MLSPVAHTTNRNVCSREQGTGNSKKGFVLGVIFTRIQNDTAPKHCIHLKKRRSKQFSSGLRIS